MSRDQYDRSQPPQMDADDLLGKLAYLIYMGNRLARGQAKPEEWHAAVRASTPEPICVLRSALTGDKAP